MPSRTRPDEGVFLGYMVVAGYVALLFAGAIWMVTR